MLFLNFFCLTVLSAPKEQSVCFPKFSDVCERQMNLYGFAPKYFLIIQRISTEYNKYFVCLGAPSLPLHFKGIGLIKENP